jgi:hypothetical protein
MWWVAPFRNLRIKGLSHLPTAYRSVTRLSSPLYAKASIKCPFALDCVNAQEYGYVILGQFTRVQFNVYIQYLFFDKTQRLKSYPLNCTVLLLFF